MEPRGRPALTARAHHPADLTTDQNDQKKNEKTIDGRCHGHDRVGRRDRRQTHQHDEGDRAAHQRADDGEQAGDEHESPTFHQEGQRRRLIDRFACHGRPLVIMCR